VRHRTDLARQQGYNVTNTSLNQIAQMEKKMMDRKSMHLLMRAVAAAAVLSLAACASSEKTPATAAVAVSHNAVDNAVSAGAPELAPEEITAARAKMMRANQALAAKDYKLARELAVQAQADAKLAQAKASSAKANAAADALNQDLRVLRQEVDRANSDTTQQ
jgi:ABC-type uncharacterized transport system substrate-binding protein